MSQRRCQFAPAAAPSRSSHLNICTSNRPPFFSASHHLLDELLLSGRSGMGDPPITTHCKGGIDIIARSLAVVALQNAGVVPAHAQALVPAIKICGMPLSGKGMDSARVDRSAFWSGHSDPLMSLPGPRLPTWALHKVGRLAGVPFVTRYGPTADGDGRWARKCKNRGSRCQRRPRSELTARSGTLGSRRASTSRPAPSSAKK
jgi:hypothetical protein